MIAIIGIVDDDDAVRDSTRVLLEELGYDVREFSSAENYIGRRQDVVDCLVVDQKMTGMSGIELLEYLRSQSDHTPALIMTGSSNSEIKQRATRIGVKVLDKPVNDDLLIVSIEEVCRGPLMPSGKD